MVWGWLKFGFEARYIGEERNMRIEMQVNREEQEGWDGGKVDSRGVGCVNF
jgi:hypothetical protein